MTRPLAASYIMPFSLLIRRRVPKTRHPSSLAQTCPYDTSSCLYLYISQEFWVACSPRLDFLYPTVTELIELVANSLSVCRLLVFSRILHPDPLVLTRRCPLP